MSANNETLRIKHLIEVGVSGLWRCFDDGMTCLSEKQLVSLFSNLKIDKPEIVQTLQLLEAEKLIKLWEGADCYLEVLRVPEGARGLRRSGVRGG